MIPDQDPSWYKIFCTHRDSPVFTELSATSYDDALHHLFSSISAEPRHVKILKVEVSRKCKQTMTTFDYAFAFGAISLVGFSFAMSLYGVILFIKDLL